MQAVVAPLASSPAWRSPYAPLYAPQPPLVPGLVNPSRLVAFEKNDVYKAGPDLGGHDSEMIGGRSARFEGVCKKRRIGRRVGRVESLRGACE